MFFRGTEVKRCQAVLVLEPIHGDLKQVTVPFWISFGKYWRGLGWATAPSRSGFPPLLELSPSPLMESQGDLGLRLPIRRKTQYNYLGPFSYPARIRFDQKGGKKPVFILLFIFGP